MINTKILRKSKIEFLNKDNKILKSSFFEQIISSGNINIDEKWFLRGCKQVAERHYTEAIKRFQLSNSDDAKLMILACTFKIADKFLFNEYYTENFNNLIYFPKYEFKPYLVIENQKYEITPYLIKELKQLF
ncbi:hypothetical protein [Hydrogenivirga sp. 128-5-R1-1]|uniref:hypothetical protein n=1 Tax=Hydrogenivirga sp. 128-5-R1-1 TaxID=392423 RepID=UPI00015F277F|nr:hypothetical protein [Hydrogenivirga sp. 128-5-R1-1]EDP73883.1 hypothetical protein HG1285_04298 [Hydrogenivirga sp. 128-5-R1-1]